MTEGTIPIAGEEKAPMAPPISKCHEIQSHRARQDVTAYVVMATLLWE